MKISMILLAAFAATPVTAVLSCKEPDWSIRTCCRNQMVHIDKYASDFLAYVCSYKKFGYLEPNGGWYCVENSVEVCCNMKEGYTAPLGAGMQHSEPRNFRCKGLSGGEEDEPPVA